MKTYYDEYAHNNHGNWLRKQLNIVPSPIGIKVANLLGYVGGGLYNCPIDLKEVNWKNEDFIEVIWKKNLTNFDDSSLTRLWVLCHRNMIRVEIGAALHELPKDEDDDEYEEPQHSPEINLLFHRRTTREGYLSERMPDCEEMIRDIDDDFKEEKR